MGNAVRSRVHSLAWNRPPPPGKNKLTKRLRSFSVRFFLFVCFEIELKLSCRYVLACASKFLVSNIFNNLYLVWEDSVTFTAKCVFFSQVQFATNTICLVLARYKKSRSFHFDAMSFHIFPSLRWSFLPILECHRHCWQGEGRSCVSVKCAGKVAWVFLWVWVSADCPDCRSADRRPRKD